MTKRTSAELKRMAREFLSGNYAMPMLAALIACFLPMIVLAPFSIGITYQWNMETIIYIIAAVIVQIFGQLLAVGISKMHLMLAKKQQISFLDVFWAFRNYPDRFILATMLRFAIFLFPAIPAMIGVIYLMEIKSAVSYVCIGLLLASLAVVELYMIYTFDLIYYLYIENPQMTVLEGFRLSCAMMRGNKKRLFWLNLSFIGWQILGMGSIGIGMLWISPYISQTLTNFYLDLTGQFDRKAEHIDVVASGQAPLLL